MRQNLDATRLRSFLEALGSSATETGRVYLTGGATAVLLGWRDATIDADVLFEPESDALYRAIPRLKDELSINVEIVAPSHFIPEVPGWRDRSRFVDRIGQLDVYHYDLYSQALSKLERGHAKDLADVPAMVEHGHVDPARLMELFESIEPALFRYPAIDPASFRARVEEFVAGSKRP